MRVLSKEIEMTQLKVTSYDADGDGVHWSIYMTQLPDGVIVYISNVNSGLFLSVFLAILNIT